MSGATEWAGYFSGNIAADAPRRPQNRVKAFRALRPQSEQRVLESRRASTKAVAPSPNRGGSLSSCWSRLKRGNSFAYVCRNVRQRDVRRFAY